MNEVSQLGDCRRLARSSLYLSTPMGPQDQPDYVNAVIAIDCRLSPTSLLRELQTLEAGHGRVRNGMRWGARTLDLDILLYAQEIIKSKDLIIPHSGIGQRSFVLAPLAEIAPELIIPGLGPVAQLLEKCSTQGLSRIDAQACIDPAFSTPKPT